MLRSSATIGRRSESDVRLEDALVSREHAAVSRTDSGVRIADLRSRHGTFVNGVRLQGQAQLAPGSIVRCGDTLLLWASDCDAYAAPCRLKGDFLGLPRDVLGGPALARLWQRASWAAELDAPVLLLGESGSGKEVVARLIHACTKQRGPFVGLNLAAVQPTLFEAELFGHERGAFTGATRARAGAFREASGGVLFLDEVGDLAQDLQAKLLRALEERRVKPVGGERDLPFDARIVSATSRNLRESCRAGTFRTDLYYRLSGIVVDVPPLRERPEDVILLALSALADATPPLHLSALAAEALALAPWPGNVRELQNVLTAARMEVRQAGGDTVQREHLTLESVANGDVEVPLTRETVRDAMARNAGNASRAAKALGVSRATLYNFCDRTGLALAALRSELDSRDDSGETSSY